MVQTLPPVLACVRRHGVVLALAGLFLAAQAYFGWIAVTQHLSHHTYFHDVGFMDSTLYWTLHGRFMYAPMIGKSHFGVHFTPTLLLILPFYAAAPAPTTLLLFQSFFLVAGCTPLFLLTRRITGSGACAVLLAALYLVNFFLASVHQASHYEALLPFFLLGAMYCAVAGHRGLYWLLFLLSLGVKTDVGLYTLFWGAYLALACGQKRRGLATMAVSAAWVAVALLVTRLLSPEGGPPAYLRYWDAYGDTAGRIVWHFATRPWLVIAAFASIRLVQLIATAGFLPLVGLPSFLLVLPPAALVLVSDQPDMRNLELYHSVMVIPFVFYSAARGLQRVRAWAGRRRDYAAVALGVMVLANASVWATVPTLTNGFGMRPFQVSRHHRLGRQLIAANIPPDATVAAQWDLYCQVPQRPGLTTLSDHRDAEFVLLDRKGWAGPEENLIPAVLSHIESDMHLVMVADGYVIARRR